MSKEFSCFYTRKIKTKDGRGVGDDPGDIVDAMEDLWPELTAKLIEEELKDESDKLRELFNTHWPQEDDLGDILFGKYADFAARIKNLDDDTQQEYTDKLAGEGIIDLELDPDKKESNLGVNQPAEEEKKE